MWCLHVYNARACVCVCVRVFLVRRNKYESIEKHTNCSINSVRLVLHPESLLYLRASTYKTPTMWPRREPFFFFFLALFGRSLHYFTNCKRNTSEFVRRFRVGSCTCILCTIYLYRSLGFPMAALARRFVLFASCYRDSICICGYIWFWCKAWARRPVVVYHLFF